MELRDIVIVGGGPAGAATAIALAQRAPHLAARALLVDRAEFPRDKTCAGGLVPDTLAILGRLGLGLDVPHVRVDRARVRVRDGLPPIDVDDPGCCWIIRRREFDGMLLDAARARGVEVRCGVGLRAARRQGDRILLETDRGPVAARAVVGADGSGSLLRRALVDARPGDLARAVMCDLPAREHPVPATFEFDFAPVFRGLPGYSWAFPCLVDGRPHWNVGVYSVSRRSEGDALERELVRIAGRRDLRRRAYPIRLYDPAAPIAAPGVVLVGDAAGVDPLLGEGISCALEFGEQAADALEVAFATGSLDFAAYRRDVARSRMGRRLARLAFLRRRFYGAHPAPWFRLAALSRRVQRRGMDWYNGVPYDAVSSLDWALARAGRAPG